MGIYVARASMQSAALNGFLMLFSFYFQTNGKLRERDRRFEYKRVHMDFLISNVFTDSINK